jgi:hypothetical protein
VCSCLIRRNKVGTQYDNWINGQLAPIQNVLYCLAR